MSNAVCVSCRHAIDAAARLCPYCGANPETGERIDTQALMQEVFRPRSVSTGESVLEYARHRQGIVLTVSAGIIFLIFVGLHQWVTMRNRTAVANAPAVALTEITDLSAQPDETRALPLPDLGFQFDGHPQTMRTFIVEPGAVTPPEVVAAQQAAAAQQQAQQQATQQAAQQAQAQQPPGAARPAAPAPPQAAPQPAPQRH